MENTSEHLAEPELETLRHPRTKVHFIDSRSALADAVEQLKLKTGWFAIDAERASGFKYSQRAYLIQIKRENSDIYLIDPIAVSPETRAEDFIALAQLLKSDRWILHAATQDLPCLNEIGLYPTELFDSELAGRLAGLPRVGLGAMVEHFLGFKLAKEHSAVDWSTRPLHADWLDYAALDVDVLHELAEGIRAELERQDKLGFAEQEFGHLTGFRPKPGKVDRWRGISGLHEVKSQRGLAIARELWLAREELAKRLDVSPGRLVPDSSLAAVAKEPPPTRSALADSKKFIGRASRTYLDNWWQALSKGSETKDLPPLKLANAGIPNHRSWPQRFPEAEKRLTALKLAMQQIAQSQSMPAENVLTPDLMRSLAWEPPAELSTEFVAMRLEALGARNWQIQLCAEQFAKALVEAEKPPVTLL